MRTYAVVDERNRVLSLGYSAVDAVRDDGVVRQSLNQKVDETMGAVRWVKMSDSDAVVGDEVERVVGRDLYQVKIRGA